MKTKCECGVTYINDLIKQHQRRAQHVKYCKFKNGEFDETKYVMCECGAVITKRQPKGHLESKWHSFHLK